MKVTYICDRCGAIIGSLGLTEDELQQMGVELSGAELAHDVIKTAPTGPLFIYSLCNHCVEAASIHEIERICLGKGLR